MLRRPIETTALIRHNTVELLLQVRDHQMGLVTFLVVVVQLVSIQSVASPMERLRAKTPVESVKNLTPVQFAGQYANPSKEVVKRVGPPLSGNNLYLFPDKTYVYCEWSDILPNTVYDKGTWNFSGNILELKSAQEISWNPELERRFLAVHRLTHVDEILLVGIEKELSYFEKEAGDDPEFMLLIVARQRDATISQTETPTLKSNLMREGWKPNEFRKWP